MKTKKTSTLASPLKPIPPKSAAYHILQVAESLTLPAATEFVDIAAAQLVLFLLLALFDVRVRLPRSLFQQFLLFLLFFKFPQFQALKRGQRLILIG